MKFLAILAIGIAIAITFLVFSYDDLTTELYYPSFAEAHTGDARTDHWIPAVLPESATEIYVVYGIDPSFLRVSFLFSESDRERMLQSHHIVDDSNAIDLAMDSFDDAGWGREPDESVFVYVPAQVPGGADEDVYLFVSADRNSAWYLVE